MCLDARRQGRKLADLSCVEAGNVHAIEQTGVRQHHRVALFVPGVQTTKLGKVCIEPLEQTAESVLEFWVFCESGAVLDPSHDSRCQRFVLRRLAPSFCPGNAAEQSLCSSPFGVEEVKRAIVAPEGANGCLECVRARQGIQVKIRGQGVPLDSFSSMGFLRRLQKFAYTGMRKRCLTIIKQVGGSLGSHFRQDSKVCDRLERAVKRQAELLRITG